MCCAPARRVVDFAGTIVAVRKMKVISGVPEDCQVLRVFNTPISLQGIQCADACFLSSDDLQAL